MNKEEINFLIDLLELEETTLKNNNELTTPDIQQRNYQILMCQKILDKLYSK